MTSGASHRNLGHLAAPDIADALSANSILVLPIGAIEQHGPHLPLATDLLVVDAHADDLIARVGDEFDLWRLPTLAVSKSNEHAWSPGTLWLSPETMLATLRDLGRSIATLGTVSVMLLNGHGGNTALLDVACRELRLEYGLRTFLVHPFLPADHGGEGDAGERGLGIHGGVSETSVMLHLHPELVHVDRMVPAVPSFLEEFRHVRFGGTVGFGWTSDDFDSGGVIGDPTLASAERGAREFDRAASYLAEVTGEIARFRFPKERRAGS
jgi:creatinine amidohydrolase